jgi:hypothetical protein
VLRTYAAGGPNRVWKYCKHKQRGISLELGGMVGVLIKNASSSARYTQVKNRER